MKCNCKTELEAKLKDRFAEKYPEATGHKAELLGYGLTVTDTGLDTAGVMDTKLTATFPLKKGGEKEKTIKHSMVFSYCPFCGTKA